MKLLTHSYDLTCEAVVANMSFRIESPSWGQKGSNHVKEVSTILMRTQELFQLILLTLSMAARSHGKKFPLKGEYDH